MFKRKQESLKSGDYCNPSLLPFKEGTKTINVICWSLSQSSRFVGNLEVPHGVIKHSDIIPWPGAFPHTCTLINPGSWTKLDFIPLSQLRTLGSTFSFCVFQSSLLLDVAFLIKEPKPLKVSKCIFKKGSPKGKNCTSLYYGNKFMSSCSLSCWGHPNLLWIVSVNQNKRSSLMQPNINYCLKW